MVKPIPDNVKEILGQLTGPQQVALRSYIATLRSEIKDLEAQVLENDDPDPHAHYHGHEKCTADHGHDEHKHDDHKHEHHDHHKEEKHHEHEHKHHEHSNKHHEHSNEHEHKHHEHSNEHDHSNKKEDDMPAWKKRAIESGASDPHAAPFGGDWGSESNVSAKDSDKMEE